MGKLLQHEAPQGSTLMEKGWLCHSSLNRGAPGAVLSMPNSGVTQAFQIRWPFQELPKEPGWMVPVLQSQCRVWFVNHRQMKSEAFFLLVLSI